MSNKEAVTDLASAKTYVFLSYIGLLALLVYLFIGLLNNLYAQEPNTVSEHLRLEEYSCKAYDPATFKLCIEEARQTGVPFIQIAAPIICTSSAECSFVIDTKRFLEIAPSAPENKFIRRGDFSYSVIKMENASTIEMHDLTFEDEGSSGCPAGTTCPAYFNIDKASDISFNNVTFNKTSGSSLYINNSRNVKIFNSNFKNSFKNGLEIRTIGGFTEGLEIKNNTFEGNGGSALTYQAWSLTGTSLITGNKFTNNHSGGAYADCTYPCTGAQVKIFGPTTNLRFDQNTVSGGPDTALDTLGLYSSGIEVGGQGITKVTLFCNEITDNRGSGIVQSPPFVNVSEITVAENKIAGNGLNLNIPTVTADQSNCFSKECTLSCKI